MESEKKLEIKPNEAYTKLGEYDVIVMKKIINNKMVVYLLDILIKITIKVLKFICENNFYCLRIISKYRYFFFFGENTKVSFFIYLLHNHNSLAIVVALLKYKDWRNCCI